MTAEADRQRAGGPGEILDPGSGREPRVGGDEPIIGVEGLTAGYGETIILKDVTFQVLPGEVLVIVGGSGCGKSTLFKHMIGLLHPAAGRVSIEGIDVHKAQGSDLARLRRSYGVMFQRPALLGSMTVGENLILPLEEHTDLSPRLIRQVVGMKLSMVQLAGYQNHAPSELSGGMQKRAGLARAMILDPRVLFFDEPAAGLDPITMAELDSLIVSINRSLGTTMVIVTHELASIYTIAHRVVMLDKSARGIIAVGSPQELARRDDDPRIFNFFHRRAAR